MPIGADAAAANGDGDCEGDGAAVSNAAVVAAAVVADDDVAAGNPIDTGGAAVEAVGFATAAAA